MKARLLNREVLPFIAYFSAMVLAALLIDGVLHLLNIVWIGRYLGIPGVLLILGSFGYSLRKHKWIKSGNIARLLRLHERIAASGSVLVLVHAGVHFNALLGWLAVGAMLINVGSGLTGKYLLQSARRRLEAKRKELIQQGMVPEVIEETLHSDSLTVDVVKRWRVVHFPIALAFAVLALAHIISIFLFWGWQ